MPLGVNHAAFYSTEALRETLADLIDLSIVNAASPRLTVGAANVRTSMMHYFDSRKRRSRRTDHGFRRVAAGVSGRQHRRRVLSGTAGFFPTRRPR